MNQLSPKERLVNVLKKKPVDRPPVICPGGMMNAAIVEVMTASEHTLPEAHHDASLMADLSTAVSEYTGFENIGVPFCMTVEAEVLGSPIDFGTLACEPKIAKEPYQSVTQFEFREIAPLLETGRISVLTGAIGAIAKKNTDIPVIGSLTGPVSTAASLVDPMTFLKELRKENAQSHKVLDYVSDFLIAYAVRMTEQGASCICIADPTATGEILGPKFFSEYAVRYLNKITDAIHRTGTPVIVHICGKIDAAKKSIPELTADAISTDAMVSLQLLKQEYPQLTTMGNLSTYLLESGTGDKVFSHAQRLVSDGVDIISPACGLSTSTPLENIKALTGAVRES